MADVKLFNSIFSDCGSAYSPVTVEGLRVGFPQNYWEDVGEEASLLLLSKTPQRPRRDFFRTLHPGPSRTWQTLWVL